jgi:PAS domain-containing protein
MDSEPHAFSEEELQALTDLCRLAEEELADIELTRLLKLTIESQARVRAVMDATSEGILLIGRDGVMGYHNRRFLAKLSAGDSPMLCENPGQRPFSPPPASR